MTTVSSLTALHATSQFPRNIPYPKKDSEPNENYPAPCLKKSALNMGKNGMYFFPPPPRKESQYIYIRNFHSKRTLP